MAPRHATVLMLFILASLALPLTSGFTAEFLILFGTFLQGLAAWRAELGAHLLIAAVLASTAMVLGAGYMLRFARAILFGTNAGASTLRDLNLRETVLLGLPLLFVFWIGIAPATLMNKVQTAAAQLARIPATVAPLPSPAVADAGNLHGK
jgi:NADH-quinone oxidoreductase subunit M